MQLENHKQEQKDPSFTDPAPEPNTSEIAVTEDSTEVMREEEGVLLDNFSKFKDDKVTTTTADESWDESGSMTSDFESVIESQPIGQTTDTLLSIGAHETRKERDKILLKQHRETYRGPKERTKSF